MVIIKNYKVKKLFNKFPEISGKIGLISGNFQKFSEGNFRTHYWTVPHKSTGPWKIWPSVQTGGINFTIFPRMMMVKFIPLNGISHPHWLRVYTFHTLHHLCPLWWSTSAMWRSLCTASEVLPDQLPECPAIHTAWRCYHLDYGWYCISSFDTQHGRQTCNQFVLVYDQHTAIIPAMHVWSPHQSLYM